MTAARSRQPTAQPTAQPTVQPTVQPTTESVLGSAAQPVPATRHNAVFMLAAYVLSLLHTARTVLDGIAPADFGANDALTYGFYGISFAFFALALVGRRAAQVAVAVFLSLQLATGVLVCSDDFGSAQQTTWGWLENGAYLGLLAIALCLTVRGVTRPRRSSLSPTCRVIAGP
ncbi:hypothetical protein GCM10009815_31640 [Nocardioides marmoribigeumensis]